LSTRGKKSAPMRLKTKANDRMKGAPATSAALGSLFRTG